MQWHNAGWCASNVCLHRQWNARTRWDATSEITTNSEWENMCKIFRVVVNWMHFNSSLVCVSSNDSRRQRFARRSIPVSSRESCPCRSSRNSILFACVLVLCFVSSIWLLVQTSKYPENFGLCAMCVCHSIRPCRVEPKFRVTVVICVRCGNNMKSGEKKEEKSTKREKKSYREIVSS